VVDPKAASWAAALFVLWFASLTFWHTAQPDGFAAMFMCFGFLPLLLTERPGWGGAVWAGVMVGLAAAIKPHYAALLLVPAVCYALTFRSRPAAVVGRTAGAALAAVVTVGAFVAWFAYRGALDALVDVHLLYNAQAYSSGSAVALGPRLRGLFEYVLAGELFVILLPAALFGLSRLRRRHPAAAWTLVTWAALAALSVVLQNKFFDYQWIPMFPPVVVLAVSGLHAALEGATPREAAQGPPTGPASSPASEPGLGHALFLVVLVHACIQPAFEVVNWASHVAGLRDRAAYYDTFGVPGDDYRMVQHIEATSGAEDRLVVLGWNMEVLYMTDRPTVSRLAYSLPVWMGEDTGLRDEYRAELMSDLRADPPELIVVAEQAEPLTGRPVSLEDFAEFNRFLAERYQPDVQYGPLALFRLRP
jgi:hypothetical protein